MIMSKSMLEIPENYPHGLTCLADCIYRELLFSVSAVSAATLAMKITEAVRKEFAGTQLYIAKGDSFDRDQRNAAILNEFNGRNHRELVRRHKITFTQLYEILKIKQKK